MTSLHPIARAASRGGIDGAHHGAAEPRPVILIAIAMTAFAEAIYFVVFGIALSPAGDFATKIVWITTCTIAIGSTMGAAVLVFSPRTGRPGALAPFAAMAGLGVYCTLLCTWLDARFGLFGGSERTVVFLLSGGIPAVAGGALYAWILNADAAAGLRRAFGGQG